jgi:hypothetical protein
MEEQMELRWGLQEQWEKGRPSSVTVDKKWGDSPFKDLEYTSQEETRTVRKQSLSEPICTENGETGKGSLSSISQANRVSTEKKLWAGQLA